MIIRKINNVIDWIDFIRYITSENALHDPTSEQKCSDAEPKRCSGPEQYHYLYLLQYYH